MIKNKLARLYQVRKDIFDYFNSQDDLDYPIEDMTDKEWYIENDYLEWSNVEGYMDETHEGEYLSKCQIIGEDNDYTFILLINDNGYDFTSYYGLFDNTKIVNLGEINEDN